MHGKWCPSVDLGHVGVPVWSVEYHLIGGEHVPLAPACLHYQVVVQIKAITVLSMYIDSTDWL